MVDQQDGSCCHFSIPEYRGRGGNTRKSSSNSCIAQRPVYEGVTLNEVFRRKKLFSEEESNQVRTRSEQIDRKLNGLVNSFNGKERNWHLEEAN